MITHAFLSGKARIARWLQRKPRQATARSAARSRHAANSHDRAGADWRPGRASSRTIEDAEREPRPRRFGARWRRAAHAARAAISFRRWNCWRKPNISARRSRAEQIQANAVALESVLGDFGVRGEIINARPGPVVTLYELEPAPGIKSSRVIGLADDIARSMSAVSARVAVVSGRNAIGIELPNPTREKVYFRELLSSRGIR